VEAAVGAVVVERQAAKRRTIRLPRNRQVEKQMSADIRAIWSYQTPKLELTAKV
jgi:hypothetical protein